MIFPLIFILSILADFRLCSLTNDIQGIKTYKQIAKYHEVINGYFNIPEKDAILSSDGMDTFILFNGKEMAGFVKFEKCNAYSLNKRKEYQMVSMYCFTIVEEYRKQGVSYMLLNSTIAELKRIYDLDDNTILALHLSPNDKKMPIATRVYHSFGFNRGLFIRNGPSEMKHSLDQLFDESRSIPKILEGKGNGFGYYLMLFCKLKDFRKRKAEIGIEDTQRLYDLLWQRKREIENN